MVNSQTGSNGEWALLEAHVPGRTPEPIGILLCDFSRDCLRVRMRQQWWDVLPDDDSSEIWQEFAQDLEQRAREVGAVELLDWLETTASHTLRLGERHLIRIVAVETTLDALFRQYVSAAEGGSQATLTTQEPMHLTIRTDRELTSRGDTLEQKSGSSLRTRFTVAALAACVTAEVLLSHGPSGWVRKRESKAERQVRGTRADTSILLPISSGLAYPPRLSTFDLLANPPSKQRRIQSRAAVARRHRQFKPHYVALNRRRFRVPEFAPPFLHIAVAGNASAPTVVPASLITPLPQPPQFKRRHNRFLHVLAVIATPFRMLASRQPSRATLN